MTTMFRDPSDLAAKADRSDPPIDHWPGRVRTTDDVKRACGDERDWFRYRHREEAFLRSWAYFRDSRQRRRRMSSNFQWNQILIIGEYGASKSTLAIKTALDYFWLGHPVFSNASMLTGWLLENEEMYTALPRMPKASVLLVDETSAHLSGMLAQSVAVTSYSDNNLNTRKKNGMVIYSSAHDWEIAPSIRSACKEVWMPIKKEDIDFERVEYGQGRKLPPADDPDNFRLAWHVWDNYPYKRSNLIEGKDAKKDGFGPPTRSCYDDGEKVRDAYLLNDTFELAQAGAARIADRDTIREALEAQRDGRQPAKRATKQELGMEAVMRYLSEETDPHGGFITGSDIAREVGGMNPMTAGRLLQQLVKVKPIQRHGYPLADIHRELDALLLDTEGGY